MRLLQNKKGTVFHYALIGIFAALGIAFLLYNQGMGVETFTLGQWESNFVEQYVLEGEALQIQEDLSMQYYFLNAINQSAANGGYAINSTNSTNVSDLPICGVAFGLAQLNKGLENCFADFSSEVANQVALIINSESDNFKDGFSVVVEEGIIYFSSEGGIKVLPGDATLDISDEEISCLEEGKVPFVSSSAEFESCEACPTDATCDRYVNQFYCDLDPCEKGCVSYYAKNDAAFEYSSCGLCPEEAECSAYVSQYYCENDACSLGCKWNVNSCIASDKIVDKDNQTILEKARIVSNPDVLTQNTEYNLDYAFTFDFTSYTADYLQLAIDARTLVNTCSNSEDLEGCLDRERLAGWYFTDCINDEFKTESRVVPFCVNSPTDLSLGFFTAGAQDLTYSFALDFTPTESFTVTGVDVAYDLKLGAYDLYFTPQDTATGYNIYMTDYALPDFQGTASEFQRQRFNSDVWLKMTFSVDDLNMTCSTTGVQNSTPYECAGELRYLVPSDQLIETDTYYFAVTSLIGETESQIDGFASS